MKDLKKVVVGFSGGVDSAMTIELLKKEGYQPIAVFLRLFDDYDSTEIKKIANKLGVELIVEDISQIFKESIIDYFIQEYRNHKTPNPCVKCNFEIKFKYLFEVAKRLRIEKVATGHYARIVKNKNEYKLLKGLDEKKDQSYFLYRLTSKELAHLMFPLGVLTKDFIKEEALRKGFFKEIKESQDVCFFNKSEKLTNFLSKNLKKQEREKGEIKDENGLKVGSHQGLVGYTQGQRKGLDLAGGPFYVIDKDLRQNVLIVSKNKQHPRLNSKLIFLESVSWVNQAPVENREYQIKIRYRDKAVQGELIKEGKIWKVVLNEFQWAVAGGQALVVYDGLEVVGGGIMSNEPTFAEAMVGKQ